MGILPVGLSVAQDARRDIPCGGDLLRYPVCHILSLGTHSDPFGVPKIITFGDQRGYPFATRFWDPLKWSLLGPL